MIILLIVTIIVILVQSFCAVLLHDIFWPLNAQSRDSTTSCFLLNLWTPWELYLLGVKIIIAILMPSVVKVHYYYYCQCIYVVCWVLGYRKVPKLCFWRLA